MLLSLYQCTIGWRFLRLYGCKVSDGKHAEDVEGELDLPNFCGLIDSACVFRRAELRNTGSFSPNRFPQEDARTSVAWDSINGVQNPSNPKRHRGSINPTTNHHAACEDCLNDANHRI